MYILFFLPVLFKPIAFVLQPWTINQFPWLLGRRLLPLHRGIRLLILLLR